MPTNPSEIDAQKAALVSAIAQQGSVGQQAFAAEATRRQAAQQAAVAQLAGTGQMTGSAGSAPAAFMKQLQGQQADNYGVYAQDAAMSGQTFANSIAATRAANEGYMNAARSALPVVNAQTAGTIAQIRAEQAQAAAERDLAREQMALEREKMAYEREQMNTSTADEKDNARLDNLINRADVAAHPAVAGALSAIDQAGYTPEQAVRKAAALIDAQRDRDTGAIPGFTSKDRLDLYRYIYEYYSGERAPVDPKALGEAFAKEGVTPSLIPGYDRSVTTAQDIAKMQVLKGQSIGLKSAASKVRGTVKPRSRMPDQSKRTYNNRGIPRRSNWNWGDTARSVTGN